jgi:hypothetical protein
MSPPSSWLKNKPNKKLATAELLATFHAGLQLVLFFDLVDVGEMFLGNVG